MKPRQGNLGLLGRQAAVLAAGGLVALVFWQVRPGGVREVEPASEESGSSTLGSPPSAIGATAGRPGELTPSRGENEGGFTWTWLKAGDLRLYVERLRRVQCPPATLQDIVLGEVDRLFGPRFAALDSGRSTYWATSGWGQRSEAEVRRLEQAANAREALERERDQCVRELLGISYARLAARGSAETAPEWSGVLGFLPDGPKKAVAGEILSRYRARERALVEAAGGTLGRKEMRARQELYRMKVEELQSSLSSEELAEFRLRDSPTAEALRGQVLLGFHPTEREYRELFRIYDEAAARTPGGESGSEPNGSSIPDFAVVDTQVRNALGADRYTAFRRSQDMTFRELLALADLYGLPEGAAVHTYNVREDWLTVRGDILNTDGLTAESRGRALQRAAGEAQRDLFQVLGESAYRAYISSPNGKWLTEWDTADDGGPR